MPDRELDLSDDHALGMSGESLDQFCRRMWPRLVGSLCIYCGNRETGEDLAQEALSRVVVKWNAVRKMNAPEAWTYRCAVNLANSSFRRRRIERGVAERMRLEVLKATSDDDVGERHAIRVALQQLPPRQRAALVLRFYADCSIEQVAAVMNCQPGTVKAHTHKAIQNLGKLYLPHEVDLPNKVSSQEVGGR